MMKKTQGRNCTGSTILNILDPSKMIKIEKVNLKAMKM